MTDYNDGKIHGWNGGDCPVHPETEVLVWLRNGEIQDRIAYGLTWPAAFGTPPNYSRLNQPRWTGCWQRPAKRRWWRRRKFWMKRGGLACLSTASSH